MIRILALAALMVIAKAGLSIGDEIKVSQANKSFGPAAVTIKSGDTIDFVNDDKIAHNVFTKGAPEDFSLGTIKPGDDRKTTFTTPGVYDVRCAIHPGMKMTVTVQ
ncbi:plastocyanin/azurin family copper-binding protein [Dongia sp.]|uniref:cupredoxin domain-containing protein n=1 Tax=Dongia sp. TaxID=1977262 RepID=UPI00374FF376